MIPLSNSGCTNLNMKKILMVKFEEKSYPSPPRKVSETISSRHIDEQEKVNSVVQPPLPLNPPPPDSSPKLMIKKEIEDGSYQNNLVKEPNKVKLPDGLVMELKNSSTSHNHEEVSKKVPMCRRFARGTCTKGSACIFRHEVDLTQLEGIYKFCWDFQNSACTRKNCRHVHATIFEEQHFYRTGYLPPHALAHQKVEPLLHPPSQTQAVDELPKQSFTHLLAQSDTNYTQVSNLAVNNTQHQIIDGVFPDLLTRSSSKRVFNDIEPFSRSPHSLDYSEPLAKKCKKCDLNEFRLEFNKNKLEDQMRSMVRLKEDLGNLDKKQDRLCMILMTLHQSKQLAKGFDKPKGLHSPININGQNDTNILGETIKMSLAKFLLGTEEQIMPSMSS